MKTSVIATGKSAAIALDVEIQPYTEGRCMVRIDAEKCTRCGGCIDLCPVIAISMINDVVTVDEGRCTGCGICVKVCPMRAPYEEKQ